MMEITSQQQLALLFPDSNKAIRKILQHATPQQLETLSQAKDLKAVLQQLMSETLDTKKSNSIILDILKNSDFFKELGNFPKELKLLVKLLQSESALNKGLQKFIQNLQEPLQELKHSDSKALKDFVKNSGVFLESNLIKEAHPKTELKAALQDLKSLLSQSDQAGVSKLIKKVESLINNSTLFSTKNSDTSSLNILKKELDTVISSLKDIIKTADPIHAKEVQRLVSSLENFSEQALKEKNPSLHNLKSILSELNSELRISTSPAVKSLNTQLEAIQLKLNQILDQTQTLPLIKKLSSALQGLATPELPAKDIKVFESLKQDLQTLSTMAPEAIESIKFDEIKSFFTSLSENLSPLNPSSTKSLFDIIERILSSLKQPLETFNQKKLPNEIKTWIANFDKEVAKGDVVFSKSLQALLDKINLFSSPAHLLDNKLLQETLQKDIKALLLGLEKELNTNPTTNATELLKSVDKLLVQVDYFQLLSHLSNASHLYLPYTWDGLENGQFSFKHKKDGSSYCEIDLELKEYGKLNMMLQLFENNQLNMTIYTQSKDLKEIFKTNIKSLKEALVSVNVMPRNISLYELNKDKNKQHKGYGDKEALKELGFEVKG